MAKSSLTKLRIKKLQLIIMKLVQEVTRNCPNTLMIMKLTVLGVGDVCIRLNNYIK
jgi:hypothetical protein